jgi:hypothetical protein
MVVSPVSNGFHPEIKFLCNFYFFSVFDRFLCSRSLTRTLETTDDRFGAVLKNQAIDDAPIATRQSTAESVGKIGDQVQLPGDIR